jgi:hypothetical protein
MMDDLTLSRKRILECDDRSRLWYRGTSIDDCRQSQARCSCRRPTQSPQDSACGVPTDKIELTLRSQDQTWQ